MIYPELYRETKLTMTKLIYHIYYIVVLCEDNSSGPGSWMSEDFLPEQSIQHLEGWTALPCHCATCTESTSPSNLELHIAQCCKIFVEVLLWVHTNSRNIHVWSKLICRIMIKAHMRQLSGLIFKSFKKLIPQKTPPVSNHCSNKILVLSTASSKCCVCVFFKK